MKPYDLRTDSPTLDFPAARKLADAEAQRLVDEPVLLAWYDRDLDFESPAHTSECHEQCDVPGYIEYAKSRGAVLQVNVDQGRFVFCYRPLGEFAD